MWTTNTKFQWNPLSSFRDKDEDEHDLILRSLHARVVSTQLILQCYYVTLPNSDSSAMGGGKIRYTNSCCNYAQYCHRIWEGPKGTLKTTAYRALVKLWLAQQADGGSMDALKIKCVQKKDGSTLRQHERVWKLFIHRPVWNGSNAVRIRLFLKALIQGNS